MTNQGGDRVPAVLVGLAGSAAGPEGLTAAGLRRRFGDPQQFEVVVGQLWRARWEAVALLVLVLDVHNDAVVAAPLSVDPPAEDEASVVLEPDLTILGQPLTVWAGLARRLPLGVLEQPLDTLRSEVVDHVRSVVAGQPAQPPPGCRAGRRIGSWSEPAADIRAQLHDELETLAAATWVPQPAVPHRSLRDVLGDRLDLAGLAAVLRTSLPEAIDLLKGKRPLTPAQAELLARAAGEPPETLLACTVALPGELIAEVDQPRWRPSAQRRARRTGQHEGQARREIAYGTFAFAARQTGPGGEPSWRDRVARFLTADGDLDG
jgi:plasmid maintenance system antidote protein VapI